MKFIIKQIKKKNRLIKQKKKKNVINWIFFIVIHSTPSD